MKQSSLSRPLSWNDNSCLIEGKPQFLVSGEFHYFRVPKTDWRRRLRLFKEAGGNCVATYIPWLIHEPEEGHFVFGGEPYLDLEGFLDVCREEAISVLCRPGPYQYSELHYHGLAAWLCQEYPNILALSREGKILHPGSVSYVHPLFLEKVKRWFEVVCPLIARHEHSRGGCVAALQIDNELMGIHEWNGDMDFNAESMGFGLSEGRYATFLSQRYPDLEALNRAYGTSFSQWADVAPWKRRDFPGIPEIRREDDYREFYFATIGDYASTLLKWFREFGLSSPVVHNSANPNMNPYFTGILKQLPEPILLGSDHYYNLGPGWKQNSPTPQWALKVFCSCEMLRLMNLPPVVWEMPGGSGSDWPPIFPEDLKCAYLTNLAFGMKGLNYYIFTGGPNPPGAGNNGDGYDYGACISSEGELRPLYEVIKDFGTFLTENSWLSEAEGISDLHVGFVRDYALAGEWRRNSEAMSFAPVDAWEMTQRGILTTSLCSSYSPGLVDLDSDSLLENNPRLVWMACASSLSRSIQTRLVRFLENGGKLVVGPVIPTLDEHYRPCRILADFLQVESTHRVRSGNPRLRLGEVNNIISKALWYCAPPPGAEITAQEESSGEIIGWELGLPQGGKVAWLGLEWWHQKNEHIAMFRWIMQRMGAATPFLSVDNPNVWGVARRHKDRTMFFLLNIFSAPVSAKAGINGGASLGTFCLPPMSVETILLKG